MTDPDRLPLNGRILGFAAAVLVLALAVKVAYSVLAPLLPCLVSLLAIWLVLRVMLRKTWR
ncbi:hypothetical protein [Mycolicibacterium sp.]|uniref:hypothetical protein n=1 Tax=Mycolicibacterium sp. TaxID=2320850 RepID=UPI0037C6BFB9